jgi:hypothetical protein
VSATRTNFYVTTNPKHAEDGEFCRELKRLIKAAVTKDAKWGLSPEEVHVYPVPSPFARHMAVTWFVSLNAKKGRTRKWVGEVSDLIAEKLLQHCQLSACDKGMEITVDGFPLATGIKQGFREIA